jgi:hypothetical protein
MMSPADPQDVRDLRWLIVALLRHGKRRFGHHKLEIGGKIVRCTPDTLDPDTTMFVRFYVGCAEAGFEAWLNARAPEGAVPKPFTQLTRFDGGVDVVEHAAFGPTTLPLYFEAMAELEKYSGIRLTQHDPRVLHYWMALYGVETGTVEKEFINDFHSPVIQNPTEFRSIFTAARLTIKDD